MKFLSVGLVALFLTLPKASAESSSEKSLSYAICVSTVLSSRPLPYYRNLDERKFCRDVTRLPVATCIQNAGELSRDKGGNAGEIKAVCQTMRTNAEAICKSAGPSKDEYGDSVCEKQKSEENAKCMAYWYPYFEGRDRGTVFPQRYPYRDARAVCRCNPSTLQDQCMSSGNSYRDSDVVCANVTKAEAICYHTVGTEPVYQKFCKGITLPRALCVSGVLGLTIVSPNMLASTKVICQNVKTEAQGYCYKGAYDRDSGIDKSNVAKYCSGF